MAKSKKGRIKKRTASAAKVPVESLEAKAFAELANGRFRRAREAFKQLVKQEGDRFLPGLIQANAGLAAEMIGRGKLSEAEQVFAYLKTIAPPETLAVLEIPLALAGEEWGKVTRLAAAALDAGQADAAAGSVLLSDALVLAGNVPAAVPGEDQAQDWRDDLRRILESLRSVSEGLLQETGELLRPIGRLSVFAEWKIFVRGLVAFHGGDQERAKAFLEILGDQTIPGKASRAYLDLLNASNWKELSEARLQGCGEVLGLSEGEAEALAASERAWRAGDPVSAYKKFYHSGGESFFSGEPWKTSVSEFFATALEVLEPDLKTKYIDFMYRMVVAAKHRIPAEARLAALVMTVCEPDERVWRIFIRAYQEEFGKYPKLESKVWEAVGTEYAEVVTEGFFQRSHRMRDPEGALEAFLRAVDLDATNLEANLKLADLYEYANDKSARNKLLDRMTVQFPHDKRILLLAGNLCIERKSFTKGMNLLGKARELDPLDRTILAALIGGLSKAAAHFYRTGKHNQARDAVKKAEVLADASDRAETGRAFLQVRVGIWEELYGEAATGREKQAQAISGAPNPFAMRFYAGALAFLYGNKKATKLHSEEILKQARREATVALCLDIWRLFHDHLLPEGPDTFVWNQVTGWIAKCIRGAQNQSFTRDELIHFGYAVGPYIPYTREVLNLITHALKKDPADPGLRLLDGILRDTILDYPHVVNDLMDEAKDRQDWDTISRLENLRSSGGRGYSSIFDDDDDDDEEDWAYDEEKDGYEDDVGGGMKGLDSNLGDIAKMTDQEFAAFRRNVEGAMEKAILDDIRRSAKEMPRGRVDPSPEPKKKNVKKNVKKTVPKPPEPPETDSAEQLNLFDL